MHANTAMVPLDDSIAYPQSHTAAFLAFRGKEWFEQTLSLGLRDAAAGIKQHDQRSFAAQSTSFTVATHVHPKLASRRHGFNCIDNQIRENLPQFSGESRDLSLPIVAFLD